MAIRSQRKPSVNPIIAPVVGGSRKISQVIVGSMIMIEVIDATPIIQIFLRACIPNIYPRIKSPQPTVITPNAFKNMGKNVPAAP